MQNSHVILIIVMATHCLVCGSRMQHINNTGLICAAGALSHEKSHAMNLIGAPEIRTATVGSGTYSRSQTPPLHGEEGLVYFERFLGLDDVAVLISGAPIRFMACDFSCDSAPAAQMRPVLLHARPAYQTMPCYDNN